MAGPSSARAVPVTAIEGKATMSTRTQMRRELQDLARLADSIPKERPTPVPAKAAPSPASTPAAAPAKPERPVLARPPTPSRISVTIPPTVASVQPPSQVARAARPSKKGGRGALISVALAGLVVAIAGGGVLGKTLAHNASGTAAAGAAAGMVAPVTPPAVPVAPAVATVTPTPVVAAAPVAAPVAAPAVAAPHVGPAAPAAPHPVVAAARKPSPKPAVIPTGGGSAAKDSLEDMIRKAVAAPSK
jgi:hypothetical protein